MPLPLLRRLPGARFAGKRAEKAASQLLQIGLHLRRCSQHFTNRPGLLLSHHRVLRDGPVSGHRQNQQGNWSSYYKNSSQFHQHFTCCFCANILSPKNYEAKLQLKKGYKFIHHQIKSNITTFQ